MSDEKRRDPSGLRERDASGPRVIESLDLFEGGTEVVILHRGDNYRLRLTRQDKLILNK
jgi:hemin uptake protein HemP